MYLMGHQELRTGHLSFLMDTQQSLLVVTVMVMMMMIIEMKSCT